MTKESKEVEEKSTVQEDSPEEKKDKDQVEETTQKDENPEDKDKDVKEEEKEVDNTIEIDGVKYTPEELKTHIKKSTDFENSVKLKKILKEESKKEETEESVEEDEEPKLSREEVEALITKRLNANNVKTYNENAVKAFSKLKQEYPWVNDDEKFEKISSEFKAGGALTVDEIFDRLEDTARKTFPELYKKTYADKIRSEVLSEQANIEAGEAGTGSSEKKSKTEITYSKEDQRMADKYFEGDVERYLKYKQD